MITWHARTLVSVWDEQGGADWQVLRLLLLLLSSAAATATN
jgi:hypothetical protein